MMASTQKGKEERVQNFLDQVKEGGCGEDCYGGKVKGDPVAYQCSICGHIQWFEDAHHDNVADRCGGCGAYAMVEVYELK